jgi:hypothetical protein
MQHRVSPASVTVTPVSTEILTIRWKRNFNFRHSVLYFCSAVLIHTTHQIKRRLNKYNEYQNVVKFYILLTVHHVMILGKWPTWRAILFYAFIFIFNSLHISSTSCSSSGETNCVNTTSGNCHSVSVAVSCVGSRPGFEPLQSNRLPSSSEMKPPLGPIRPPIPWRTWGPSPWGVESDTVQHTQGRLRIRGTLPPIPHITPSQSGSARNQIYCGAIWIF